MSYSFWGSYNAKYSLIKKDAKISLMKEDNLVWENYIDNINVISADVFNNGTVIIHSDKMCYIIKAGNSRIEPMVDFSYDNLCKSNDKFIKFSVDGTYCMYLKYEIKKGFSLFGSKQTINDKSQIEYELVLCEMKSKKQTVVQKFTVINKNSSYIFWNVSRDFTKAFTIIPKESSGAIILEIRRFDLRNIPNQIKPMSIPACSVLYTEIYKTGTILLMINSNGIKGILIITPECETFNLSVENNESCIYLARGFVVLEKLGPSSERIFTIKNFKNSVITNYSMAVFKNNNVDFGIFFDDKDFLTIVYYFKDKYYFFPADVLTLTTEIRRFEMILESDKQSKVYETGTSYFEDYYDSPDLDESAETKKTEHKVDNFEKPRIETPVKRNNFTQSIRQTSFAPKKEVTKQKVLKVSSEFSNLSLPKFDNSSIGISNKINYTSNQDFEEVSNPLDFSANSNYDDMEQSSYSHQDDVEQNFQSSVRNSGRLSLNPASYSQQDDMEQNFPNSVRNSGRLSLNPASYSQQDDVEQNFQSSVRNSGRLKLNPTSYSYQNDIEQNFQDFGRKSGRLKLNPTSYSHQSDTEQNLQDSVQNSGRLKLEPTSYSHQSDIEHNFQNSVRNSGRLTINSQQISTDNIQNNDNSDIDIQTGLYTSSFREKKLFELAEECKIAGLEFSVLRIVLDNYSNLEEIFGERYVLTMRKMVIDLINRLFPKDCFICIISKYEFSVIMKDVSFDEAYSKAFLMHNRISEIRFTYQSETLTSSIIVGTFPAFESDIGTFKDLIERGTIFALNSGGNQVFSLRELFSHESEAISNDFINIDNFEKLNVNDDNQKTYNTFLDTADKKEKIIKEKEQINNDDVEIKKINKLLESIEDRYLLGELNESSYNDLKTKYLRQLNSIKNKE